MAEKRIYVDTNVFIDFFEDRNDGLRPLGELASQLFQRAFGCEFRIITSSLVLKELKDNNHLDDYTEFVRQNKKFNKFEFVNIANSDKAAASKGKNSHYQDRLHYILAEKANAELFITRNWKDFCGLGKIPVLLPEYA